MNLKEETLEVLHNNGKHKEDVKYVCGEDFLISLEQFWKLADTEYNSSYGAPEIATDLLSSLCVDCSDYSGSGNCPLRNGSEFCGPENILEWLQSPAGEDIDHA